MGPVWGRHGGGGRRDAAGSGTAATATPAGALTLPSSFQETGTGPSGPRIVASRSVRAPKCSGSMWMPASVSVGCHSLLCSQGIGCAEVATP